MASTTSAFRLLPMSESTSQLCFDKDQFMKDDFDVDNFVADCRHRVQLETLREDLHIYFKSLKNAMVELINKDYADFVNLSSNLVGMDKAINNLSVPLGQLKEEVLSVRSGMDDANKAVEDKLAARARIREKKACLQRLINITKSVEKMENILGISRGTELEDSEIGENLELSGQQIERVASEFNQLQYYVTQSKGLPMVEKIRPRIAAITVTLQHSLERSFEESLELGQADVLRQCLRTYATIDKMRDAEALFRKIAVKPYMDEVITEKVLHDHPQGLKGLYSRVLEFIPKHCTLIRQVTSQTPSSTSQEVVRGYDFLVNAVWPEIASSLETRTHSIFAPGNPDIFHEKFLQTMDFVERFERHCGTQSSVKRLRAHPSFSTFMSKWSLPVYFQLRFQEIAGQFETSLSTPFNIATDTKGPFKLYMSQTLWQCLHRCWGDQVYLIPLCHRFWKLTLQLLSRCSQWIEEIHENEVKESANKEPASSSKPPVTSSTSSSTSSPSESGEPEDFDKPPRGSSPSPHHSSPPPITSGQLVSLVADIDVLCSQLMQLYQQVIGPKIAEINCQGLTVLSEAFLDCKESLSHRQVEFGEFITKEVCASCSVHLKSANDIPRLYRRTNREKPNKPSTYVCNCLKPLELFLNEHKDNLQEERTHQWIVSILSTITDGYLTISSELLTSVKKMEDSLKRLKALRRTSEAGTAIQPGVFSDDDKIRLQLALDVKYFGTQIADMEIQEDEIPSYQELKKLVESSVN